MAILTPDDRHLKTGESVTIRSAMPDDAAAILALTRAVVDKRCFFVTAPEEFDFSEEEQRSRIAEYGAAPDKLIIVAEHAGSMVGALWSEAGSRQRVAHRATLHMLVERPWRGRGVGGALLRTLIGWADEHPAIEKLSLAVHATNTAAIALYRRFGFVEEGRRPRELKFGPDEYLDEVLMYRFVSRSARNSPPSPAVDPQGSDP